MYTTVTSYAMETRTSIKRTSRNGKIELKMAEAAASLPPHPVDSCHGKGFTPSQILLETKVAGPPSPG